MIDQKLFDSVLDVIKVNRDDAAKCYDIIDSFSIHQRECKEHLVSLLKDFDAFRPDKEVVIWGSWYGSIFVPLIHGLCSKLNCIDLDEEAIKTGRKLFSYITNVIYRVDDIFEIRLKRYRDTCVVINTSCEHMPPMNQYKYFKDFEKGTFFAFQSNNMFNIDDHTNCVNTLDEFEMQMPMELDILYSDEIDVPGWEDFNGKRFTIIARKVC